MRGGCREATKAVKSDTCEHLPKNSPGVLVLVSVLELNRLDSRFYCYCQGVCGVTLWWIIFLMVFRVYGDTGASLWCVGGRGHVGLFVCLSVCVCFRVCLYVFVFLCLCWIVYVYVCLLVCICLRVCNCSCVCFCVFIC